MDAWLRQMNARLLRSIELQPANPNGLASLHSDLDRSRQRRLPRLQISLLNSLILVHPSVRNLLPGASILLHRLGELVAVLVRRARFQNRSSLRRGTSQSMRQRLVLVLGRRGRCGRGEVGAFEVCCGESGDVVSDGRSKLRDGFLDLGGIVVGFCVVDLGDPAQRPAISSMFFEQPSIKCT